MAGVLIPLRACADCGCDISQRGRTAKRCAACQRERGNDRRRKRRAELRGASAETANGIFREWLTCRDCDDLFLSEQARQYCDECRTPKRTWARKAAREHERAMERKRKRPKPSCGECGDEFTPPGSGRYRYCDECRTEERRRNVGRVRDGSQRPRCNECGDEFTPQGMGGYGYCDKCRGALASIASSGRVAVCADQDCGAEFTPPGGGNYKYCDECRTLEKVQKRDREKNGHRNLSIQPGNAGAREGQGKDTRSRRRAGTGQRVCQRDGCGADISHRHLLAKFCDGPECATARHRESARKAQARHRARQMDPTHVEPTILCQDCGNGFQNPVKQGSNYRYCKECRTPDAAQRRQNAARRGPPRQCKDCGKPILGRGPRATRCRPCADQWHTSPERKAINSQRVKDWKAKKAASDAEWVQKEKDKAAERARQKREDPEYRKIVNARTREYQNEQYANNHEWQAKAKRKSRVRRQILGGRKPRRYWPILLERDGPFCGICGGYITSDAFTAGEFHVDHKHPVALAQTYLGHDINDLSNLQLAHPSCNISKQDELPERLEPPPPAADHPPPIGVEPKEVISSA